MFLSANIGALRRYELSHFSQKDVEERYGVVGQKSWILSKIYILQRSAMPLGV